MTPYNEMPPVEMTVARLRELEDRSNFLGLDRIPGQCFRCNLNYIAGPPKWVVGTFYIDEDAKAETLENREKNLELKSLFPDTNFVKIRWEQVVFTDGSAPEQTIGELQGLIRRHDETKAKLGL